MIKQNEFEYDDGECVYLCEIEYAIDYDDSYGEDIDGRRGQRRAFFDCISLKMFIKKDPDAAISDYELIKPRPELKLAAENYFYERLEL